MLIPCKFNVLSLNFLKEFCFGYHLIPFSSRKLFIKENLFSLEEVVAQSNVVEASMSLFPQATS